MRPRTAAYSSFNDTTRGMPGPGTYNLDALSIKNDHCVVSTIRSYGVPLIKRGARFNNDYINRTKFVPGPGHYKPKVGIDPKG